MPGYASSPYAAAGYASMGPASTASGGLVRALATAVTAAKIVHGDYLSDPLDPGGLTQAGDKLQEEAAFRLGTVLGSFSGDFLFGSGVVYVPFLDPTAAGKIQNAAQLALAPMVTRGAIKNVVIAPAPYVTNGTAVAFFAVAYQPTGLVE